MAEIHGIQMTDEQFMLCMELGSILRDEGYDTSSGTLDPDKVKSERGKAIIKRLEEISKQEKESK
jgi:hypothetical protein